MGEATRKFLVHDKPWGGFVLLEEDGAGGAQQHAVLLSKEGAGVQMTIIRSVLDVGHGWAIPKDQPNSVSLLAEEWAQVFADIEKK